MERLLPTWDSETESYFIKKKLPGGQTVAMYFELVDQTIDTDYYNIALCVVGKRKQQYSIFDAPKITGKDPVLTFSIVRNMFESMVGHITEQSHYHNYIYCYWLDGRRRDVYYKFLSRYGFQYGTYGGRKVLYKIYPPTI